MNSIVKTLLTLLLGFAIAPAAFADAGEDADEATITVIEDGATPDDVVKVIELPDHASATAAAKSAAGVDTASAAKDKSGETGRDFGQQVSEDARNNNISDEARADAKQQGRSDNANGGNRRGPPH
jgi:hypothetical protein